MRDVSTLVTFIYPDVCIVGMRAQELHGPVAHLADVAYVGTAALEWGTVKVKVKVIYLLNKVLRTGAKLPPYLRYQLYEDPVHGETQRA